MATIVVDKRERDKADRSELIIKYFEPFLNIHNARNGPQIAVTAEQIGTSDYSVMLHSGQVTRVALGIERKTWKDLSASIPDRLAAQIKGMKALRESTNCKLLLIIEGNAPPPNKRSRHMKPLVNMQAKLDHLLLRDNIPYIRTKNQQDTCKRIVELTNSLIKLQQAGQINGLAPVELKRGGVPDELWKGRKKTNSDVIYEMWHRLPGVSEQTRMVLMDKFGLVDLTNGSVSVDEIAEVKYFSGRNIGERSARKILSSKREHHIRILACIPGLSQVASHNILANFTLSQLCDASIEAIRQVDQTEKKKIGKKMAEKIKILLCQA